MHTAFGRWQHATNGTAWEVADSAATQKRKWLLVNDCDCKSLTSTATVPMWNKYKIILGIVLKSNDTSEKEIL
jgi:hypothetical protein